MYIALDMLQNIQVCYIGYLSIVCGLSLLVRYCSWYKRCQGTKLFLQASRSLHITLTKYKTVKVSLRRLQRHLTNCYLVFN